MRLIEKLRGLLRGKSYWITQSRVWRNDWIGTYHPYRKCANCSHVSRFASNYCPNCGRKMTHETKPIDIISAHHIIDEHGTKRWNDLYQEEQEWEARLLKGVPIEEYRAWKKKQETP